MRHIKRYEECDSHPLTEPVVEKREIKDSVLDTQPYPCKEAEDRSYEVQLAAQRYVAGELTTEGFSHLLTELNSSLEEVQHSEYFAELERLKKQSKGLI